MYLQQLYSEPQGLFERVEFKDGVNFIFGKKDTDGDPKKSLNSIGKSTLLDLIDFCLLASFNKTHNRRLFAAKDILSNFYICLDFTIGENNYCIKRCADRHREVYFSENGVSKKINIDDLKIELGKKIFSREKDYVGIFNPKWFRRLMNFYLKIQKHNKVQFSDPIKYMKDVNEVETNIYQLYLLGLNNKISHENLKVRTDLKNLAPAIEQIESILRDKYNLHNLKETNININRLKYDINKYEKAIQTFELKEEYKDVEENANRLTNTIKDYWLNNYIDRKTINSYEKSYSLPEKISPTKIKNIYDEFSKEFSLEVKKTLTDAINFRKKLSESRKSFLSEEILTLQKKIKSREEFIIELESERAKLFSFLSAKEAIKDLTEAFNIVSEKRSELNDLESSTKILNDLNTEKSGIELELKRIETEAAKFVNELSNQITQLYGLFTSVYDSIYINDKNQSNFIIDFQKKKQKFIEISISMPDMYGHGKNHGRTLIYDLFVIINSFKFPNNFPKFLIHDGIFDGMDKAHFIAVYEYIESLISQGKKIQYITTINEEGNVSGKFGHSDKVTMEKIEDEAISVLSPNKKLFGKDFGNVE